MKARHHDTLILGAGMSGLACASRLLKHESYASGKHTLAVLEARNRIGGRVANVHVNGTRLDIGANWIHGTGEDDEPNPLMDILPNKRTKVLRGNVICRMRRPADDKHEKHVVPSEVAGGLFGTFWQLLSSMNEKAFKMPKEESEKMTALDGIVTDKAFQSAFDAIPAEYHSVLQGMPQFLENMEAGPFVPESAEKGRDAEGTQMSLSEWANDDFDGEDLFLCEGYSPLIEEVGKEVVKGNCIQLNTEITHIEWSLSPIKIHTKHGIYTADQVVCTIPLGVLKWATKQSSPFFNPALPVTKQKAIDSLGFGTLDKIFLVYKHAWWNDEPWCSIIRPGLADMFNSSDESEGAELEDESEEADLIFGFTEKLPGFSVHRSGKVEAAPCLLSIVNLRRLTDLPVLMTFVSCQAAQMIEDMSNEDAADVVHTAMADWFGQAPPKPDGIHVTRWSQDPFSRGSYSHMIARVSKMEHRQQFEEPLINDAGNVVRFAGEHTSVDHFATVHAALISGWREADAILEQQSGVADI